MISACLLVAALSAALAATSSRRFLARRCIADMIYIDFIALQLRKCEMSWRHYLLMPIIGHSISRHDILPAGRRPTTMSGRRYRTFAARHGSYAARGFTAEIWPPKARPRLRGAPHAGHGAGVSISLCLLLDYTFSRFSSTNITLLFRAQLSHAILFCRQMQCCRRCDACLAAAIMLLFSSAASDGMITEKPPPKEHTPRYRGMPLMRRMICSLDCRQVRFSALRLSLAGMMLDDDNSMRETRQPAADT